LVKLFQKLAGWRGGAPHLRRFSFLGVGEANAAEQRVALLSFFCAYFVKRKKRLTNLR